MSNRKNENKRNPIKVNLINKTIELTNANFKKACVYGSDEYKELKEAIAENPKFKVNVISSTKKTYSNLTFNKMRDYIKTQFEDQETQKSKLEELEKVIEVADAKNGKYPLTKKWFLDNYPEYKDSEIKTTENKTATNLNVIENEAA